jgi:hypothetical protein
MRLDDGWNQIQFNLSDFTRRAYGTNYIETLRVQVCVCFFFKNLFYFIFSKFILKDTCKLPYSKSVLFRSIIF